MERPISPPAREIIVRADEVDETGTDIALARNEDGQPVPIDTAAAATAVPTSPVRPILRREGSAPPPPPPRQPPPPAPPADETASLSLEQLRDLVSNLPAQSDPVAYAYVYEDTRTLPEELDEWWQYTHEDRALWRKCRESFESCAGDRAWLQLSTSDQEGLVRELLDWETDRTTKVEALAYLAMGVWGESAHLRPTPENSEAFEAPNERYLSATGQLQCINDVARLLCRLDVPAAVSTLFQQLNVDASPDDTLSTACMTILYFVIEAGRRQGVATGLDSSWLPYLAGLLASVRWDDTHLNFTRMMLLTWKSWLLLVGGTLELIAGKKALRSRGDSDDPDRVLKASPLQYQAFRSELISKYPTYNPPPPMIPWDISPGTPLPSLPAEVRSEAPAGSIFDRPVHIATPAPSPPPSPVGPGGKQGRKQNYQTNQHFPFLYPLSDERPDHDDIPASIVEAAQLFADRMRMSRSARQLWEVHEQYVQVERGWTAPKTPTPEPVEPQLQARLDLVDEFYRRTLPDLQSLIIALLKVLLSCTTAQSDPVPSEVPLRNMNLAQHLTDEPAPDLTLNLLRTREITAKAITGFLLMLTKWLRLSHVLRGEYLLQLLLDSNFLPLSLKYIALLDLDRAVDTIHDDTSQSFFHFAADVNAPARPPTTRPEVDELGCATTQIPDAPLTSYAPRYFFTYITTLRLLQRLTKHHAHRALLLVSYKSSTILRKGLRIPQPTLRLYTLKLFKSQVAYCPRKWRSANMKTITAVFMFVRMSLRDDWIAGPVAPAGASADEWAASALAVERAWRGLTGFWHAQTYRRDVGQVGLGTEEEDFFTRELEKLGLDLGDDEE